jgi:hypothetical protein
MKKLSMVLCGWALVLATAVSADQLVTAAPADAKVYFIAPLDGQTVAQTFTVKFGLSGMGVAPAGVERDNTGHHHLLIDTNKLPDMTQSLPATDSLKHFGGGQTETTLTLAPGQHSLQLLLGNYAHVPHSQPVLSKKITIYVK